MAETSAGERWPLGTYLKSLWAEQLGTLAALTEEAERAEETDRAGAPQAPAKEDDRG